MDCRILFVEEVAWVVGKLIFAAKDVVLVVVEYAILSLIPDRYGSRYRNFKDPGAATIVEQNPGVVETLDHSFDHCVGAFAITLHTQTPPAADEFGDHCVGKARANL